MSACVWASYDPFADDYDAISVPHYFQGPAEQLVALLGLSREDTLLDVGAGTGVVAAAASRIIDSVVAVDVSLPMLRRAQARGRLLAVVSELPHLSFRAESFTCATASFVLNHLENPLESLREIRVALRPGGRLGVTSWAVGPSDNEIGQTWTEAANLFLDQALVFDRVSAALPGEQNLAHPRAVAEQLGRAGLSVRALIEKVFPVSISLQDYVASRSLAMSARFMRQALSREEWGRFESKATDQIRQRFGSQLQFATRVNFAVGINRTGSRLKEGPAVSLDGSS